MKKSVLAVVLGFEGVLTNGGAEKKQSAWSLLYSIWSNEAHDVLCRVIKRQTEVERPSLSILRETFNSLDITEALVTLLVSAYGSSYHIILQNLLEQSGMPEGTEVTLEKLTQSRFLFVSSAIPEEIVRQSLKNFGIAGYFREIFGLCDQRNFKAVNLNAAYYRMLQLRPSLKKSSMLSVGDSDADRYAAKEFGCAFVGVANSWNKWRTKRGTSRPSILIDSIAELPALLAR